MQAISLMAVLAGMASISLLIDELRELPKYGPSQTYDSSINAKTLWTFT